MHHMFPEVFLLAEESQDEKNAAEVGRNEGGFMDGSGQEKGPETHGDVEARKDNSDFWHDGS